MKQCENCEIRTFCERVFYDSYNEIKKENLDKTLKLIDKINKKSNLNIAKGSDVILTLFLLDYYKDNRLSEKSEADLIKEVSKIDNSIDCKEVLKILYEKGILLKAVCKDINNNYIDKYALSYVYIEELEKNKRN